MSESQAPETTEIANPGSNAGGSQASDQAHAEGKPSARQQFSIAFVTEHFVVISAVSVLASSVLTLDFVFAYLGSFDWNLIWIIEYPDLTKFVLVGTALVTAATLGLSSFAVAILYRLQQGQRLRWYIGSMIVAYILFTAIFVYLHRGNGHRQTYDVLSAVSSIWAGYLVYMVIANSRLWFSGNLMLLFSDITITLFVAALFGSTFAMRVKYAEPMLHDVMTTDHA